MKLKLGNGKFTEWFNTASNDELIVLEMMSPGAIERICMMLTVEAQMMKEKK